MLLTGISNGVTHLQLSCDGNLLHTGFRKVNDSHPFTVHLHVHATVLYLSLMTFHMQCDLIQSWDLRNPGKILYEMKRAVHTNQRIYFDLYE